MSWECKKCGHRTPKGVNNCESCGIDRMQSMAMVLKRRRSCEECGHIHREHVYCHVYTEAAMMDELEQQDVFSDEDEESDDDSEDGPLDGIVLLFHMMIISYHH